MYTELELVNHILHTLGEENTPTLETTHPAVVQARNTLVSYNKEFQQTGWWFNKELNVKLLPDNEGRVRLPSDTMEFRVTQCLLMARMPGQKIRFVKRGRFIYDAYEHTNILNCAVWADLTVLLPIEDLPAAAGNYLKHFAAESAYLADDGDLNAHSKLQQKTALAWADLKAAQIKATGPNAYETPHMMQFRNATLGSGGSGRRGVYLGG